MESNKKTDLGFREFTLNIEVPDRRGEFDFSDQSDLEILNSLNREPYFIII